ITFAMIAPHLGSEFVPRLSEGAIAVSVVRLAGTDLRESTRYNTQMEKAILATFPDEVAHVWSRSGTAEVATDPMGVELTDLFITLKPREQWRATDENGNPITTQTELTEQIEKTLRDMPGQHFESSQPIEMRLNEMVSGVKSAVAVKLFGDDFAVLREKAREIERVLNSIDGHTDVTVEQITGQPVLEIKIDQRQIARYGIPAKDVLDLIQSLGSKPLGEVIEGQMRFPLVVHLPDKYRTSPKAIGAMLVTTPAGGRVPLERLATIERLQGPSTITREWGQRRIVVSCNVRGRDVGSFVDEARDRVEAEVPLPDARYHLEWGGQFENLQRARTRLLIVLPIALGLIFGLLYLTYHNAVDALRVFASVPFAWVGGVLALWLRGMPFSIPAAVGFIALSGVAVLNDMILVSYTALLREQGLCIGEAVEHAALTRLRPVLMTALVASLGFLPMAMSTGMGAEVQRPLATVVIGGVISAMLTSLIVSRVIYLLFDSGAQAVYLWLRRGFGVGTAVLQPLFGLHGARSREDLAGPDSTQFGNDD
ncbi:MAG TPA: efflux RND transporter permease subunit, partial [Gemmataceae bacterium]|nr:efflux RND transporter permease subunit [Gemmataceae bacterium]